MISVRLAMTLLVGCTVLGWGPAYAEAGGSKPPEVRRLNLDLKGMPLRKALDQVFTPGGLRVKLEANVPALPVTLALKEVDPDTAFRLLMRQAKKQEKDLQYEAIDEGYRIYLGAPTEETQAANPYPLSPQPKLPKPLAPPTPDFPVVQNREVEPFIATLLQRTENGDALLPAPKGSDTSMPTAEGEGDERDVTVTFGTGTPADGGQEYSNYGGSAYGGLGQGSLGNYGGYGGYGNSGLGGYGQGGYALGGYGLGSYGGGGMRGFQPADPYRSPLAGGLSVSDQVSQRLYEKKKKPLPYFYDHHPQWILERRTTYFGPPHRPTRPKGGNSGPKSGGDGPLGGGYLPR